MNANELKDFSIFEGLSQDELDTFNSVIKFVEVPTGGQVIREGEVGEQVGAPTAAGLGIDHHGVDGQRIELPLPPVALLAPGEIGAVGAFQHQPFGRGLPRALADAGEVLPRSEIDRR